MKKRIIILLLSAMVIGGLGFSTSASATVYNGWTNSNGIWSYYNNGQKLTGWIKLGQNWYYLDSTGSMMTGLQKIDGQWYYFETSGKKEGVMICNANVGSYSFGNDGSLITKGNTLLPDEAYAKLEEYLSENGYDKDEDSGYEYEYYFDEKTNSLKIAVYSIEDRIVRPFLANLEDYTNPNRKKIRSEKIRLKQIEVYINLKHKNIRSYSYLYDAIFS